MQELTPEQLRIQEITATKGTMGWQYLVEDFESKIKALEEAIHDPYIDDIPKYSLRSLFITQSNCLRTMIDTPHKLINLLTSNR